MSARHNPTASDFDDRPWLYIDADARKVAAEDAVTKHYDFSGAVLSPSHFDALMAPEQRQKLWTDWRAGKDCQQIIQAAASGEIEYGDGMEAAFLAGIEAALRK